MCGTRLKNMHDLGRGIYLYLKLLKGLAITFLIMSAFAIPSLILSFAGARLDNTGTVQSSTLGRSTIANIDQGSVTMIQNGPDVTVSTRFVDYTVNVTFSTAPLNVTWVGGSNSTNVTAQGAVPEIMSIPTTQTKRVVNMSLTWPVRSVAQLAFGTLKPKEISMMVSCLDAVQILVLLGFIVWYRALISRTEKYHKTTVEVSDYAVFVRGLPKDATEEEIKEHFNMLYALDRSDWEYPGHCGGCWGKKVSRHPEDITDEVSERE